MFDDADACGAGSTDCDSLLAELTLNEPQTTSDKATPTGSPSMGERVMLKDLGQAMQRGRSDPSSSFTSRRK